MADNIQTITLANQRFVILPESEFHRLTNKMENPPILKPDENRDFPVVKAAQELLACDILRARRVVGLTQIDLARLAGIRPETLSRIEKGRHAPSGSTLEKIDRALTRAVNQQKVDEVMAEASDSHKINQALSKAAACR